MSRSGSSFLGKWKGHALAGKILHHGKAQYAQLYRLQDADEAETYAHLDVWKPRKLDGVVGMISVLIQQPRQDTTDDDPLEIGYM
jgi:hypothetical protein